MFLTLQQDLNLAIAHLSEYLLTGDKRVEVKFLIVEDRLDGYLLNFEESLEEFEPAELTSNDTTNEVKQLLDEFRQQSKKVLLLRGNNTNNFPGIQLASSTLNPVALEFFGIINNILTTNDIYGSDQDIIKARYLLNELRYNWSRMISNFRLFLTVYSNDNFTNFNNFLDKTGEILNTLQKMQIEVGFDAIESLNKTHHNLILLL